MRIQTVLAIAESSPLRPVALPAVSVLRMLMRSNALRGGYKFSSEPTCVSAALTSTYSWSSSAILLSVSITRAALWERALKSNFDEDSTGLLDGRLKWSRQALLHFVALEAAARAVNPVKDHAG